MLIVVLLGLSYSVTDLGTLAGDSTSVGVALNDAGEVAGNSQTFLPHAFRYSGAVMEDLGDFGAEQTSTGEDIAADGTVVGSASSADGLRAYVAVPGGDLVDLGTAGGWPWSWAYAISAHGIVGELSTSQGARVGFFDGGPGLVALSDLNPALTDSTARDINDVGQIVGWTDGFAYRLERTGSLVPLGGLGGGVSEAVAINAAGSVAGTAIRGDGTRKAFRYVDGAGLIELPDLGGASEGRGINDDGWVVGESGPAGGGRPTASLWPAAGGHVELNRLVDPASGWILESAADINNVGQIAGKGFNGPASRAVLLTPIPPGMALTGPAPGLAGQDNTLTVTGVVPGASVVLVRGLSPGVVPIDGLCLGVGVEVFPPVLLAGPLPADAGGQVDFTVSVPGAASGVTGYIQAVSLPDCAWSQVVAHSFP